MATSGRSWPDAFRELRAVCCVGIESTITERERRSHWRLGSTTSTTPPTDALAGGATATSPRAKDLPAPSRGGRRERRPYPASARRGRAGETTKRPQRWGGSKAFAWTTPTQQGCFAGSAFGRPDSAKLFVCSRAQFARAWNATGRALRLRVGPPHSVRHSGASHDAAMGYNSMWQIPRRGRWGSERPVLGYVMSHAWVEERKHPRRRHRHFCHSGRHGRWRHRSYLEMFSSCPPDPPLRGLPETLSQ